MDLIAFIKAEWGSDSVVFVQDIPIASCTMRGAGRPF